MTRFSIQIFQQRVMVFGEEKRGKNVAPSACYRSCTVKVSYEARVYRRIACLFMTDQLFEFRKPRAAFGEVGIERHDHGKVAAIVMQPEVPLLL